MDETLRQSPLSVIMSIKTPTHMSKTGELIKPNAMRPKCEGNELFDRSITNCARHQTPPPNKQPNNCF